jgi:hypothetical protein
VTTYTRSEAAERAGFSPEELGRFADLGILHPGEGDRFSTGDIRKATLVHGMVEAGLPLEGLVAVITSGALPLEFMDSPAYDRFTALSNETFAQASARTGTPVELLMLAREAVGGAMPIRTTGSARASCRPSRSSISSSRRGSAQRPSNACSGRRAKACGGSPSRSPRGGARR